MCLTGVQAVIRAQQQFEAAVAAGNTSLVRRLLTISPGSEQGSTSILTMATAVEQACARLRDEGEEDRWVGGLDCTTFDNEKISYTCVSSAC